ncbi:MAG: acyl-CoA/acyl-ACP dehydrogenase [Acidimicrobiaceae bacterium]|nr:acyl-CoA/acyl-ACP dehydrogenase [Acidimicrobiaceae bacterium]
MTVDFELGEEEQAVRDLTAQVLDDMSSHERLKALAAEGDHVDRKAWAALAATGVVGASIPEAHGGLGLGFLATAVALEEVGRRASPVPLLTTAVMGGMPIAAFGTEDQKAGWLPGIADGSVLACAALAEDGAAPVEPTTAARSDNGGFVLDGTKVLVAGGLDADVSLVPARLDDGGVGVFIVPTGAEGLERVPVGVTTGRPEARCELSGVWVDAGAQLGAGAADGTEIVRFIERHANVGLCMTMSGAARAAIELAADYTKQRHQFDRPIATFQAVSQRAGDSYIDAEAIWLTAYQAAWRLSAGLPADREIAIAKYWASEGGFRVVHAAVHVHGGVGVDRDYPLHRHFLVARHMELTLGHAEEQLADLGRLIAAP